MTKFIRITPSKNERFCDGISQLVCNEELLKRASKKAILVMADWDETKRLGQVRVLGLILGKNKIERTITVA